MRVLHIITSLEIGGAQRLLADLLPLQITAMKVDLLVYERVYNQFEKTLEQAGINIISLGEHNFYNPRVIAGIRKIIKGYDLVHAHLFPTIYWVSLAAIGLKVKLIYTEHSTYNSRRSRWYFHPIERFMYSRYDRVISISKQTQDALTSWLRQTDGRFVVINNGVDTSKFALTDVPVNSKSLIMVSRFADSKDQGTVIRAMSLIDDEATLYLVGDGDNRAQCEALAKEMGISDRVFFLGARSDVPELVAASYIGIQSSNWEGFGLTAVEMMACGKPVIATNVDGLRQVVEGAGEIFELGNASELAAMVNRLLAEHAYYQAMSSKCKERAKEYDIKLMSDSYLQLYKSLM